MTVPSKITEEARAVRAKLCIDTECTFDNGCGCLDVLTAAILAAEQRGREMAAKVAEEIGESYGEDETGWLDCSETIAAAIRSRTTEG